MNHFDRGSTIFFNENDLKLNKKSLQSRLYFYSRVLILIIIMADLEAVLADVSYLMAMEKSKSTPAASASKKIVLPDRTYVSFFVEFLSFVFFIFKQST